MDLPSTNNSKAPVAPVLKTRVSFALAENSVSYFAEKPSNLTPEANSCCPAVVIFIGFTICCDITLFPSLFGLFQ